MSAGIRGTKSASWFDANCNDVGYYRWTVLRRHPVTSALRPLPAETEKPLLTAGDLARQHQTSAEYFRAAARRGELPCVRLGRAIRFKPADVATFVEAHTVPAAARR
jgi:excisionase family DNA binding protein